jgi:hypothetical protein
MLALGSECEIVSKMAESILGSNIDYYIDKYVVTKCSQCIRRGKKGKQNDIKLQLIYCVTGTLEAICLRDLPFLLAGFR